MPPVRNRRNYGGRKTVEKATDWTNPHQRITPYHPTKVDKHDDSYYKKLQEYAFPRDVASPIHDDAVFVSGLEKYTHEKTGKTYSILESHTFFTIGNQIAPNETLFVYKEKPEDGKDAEPDYTRKIRDGSVFTFSDSFDTLSMGVVTTWKTIDMSYNQGHLKKTQPAANLPMPTGLYYVPYKITRLLA